MYISKRQATIPYVNVPPIKFAVKDVKGYGKLIDAFTKALFDKMGTYRKEEGKIQRYMEEQNDREHKIFKDCFEQTVTFLKHIHALKPLPKTEIKLKLWKDAVAMHPFYEGINGELKTMLIHHHYPSMAAEIDTGHIYDHYGLTQVGEAVLYLMEYFQKEKLLNEVSVVLETKETKQWMKNYEKYCQQHTKELEQESEIIKQTRKSDFKKLDKSLGALFG
jgi:hypothetical protein